MPQGRYCAQSKNQNLRHHSPMDALSEVLRVCRLRGATVMNADLGAPWRVAVGATTSVAKAFLPEAESPAVFHVVLSGECLVQAFGAEPLRLREGEAVLLVKGGQHRLASSAEAPDVTFTSLVRPPIAGELTPIRHGGSGTRTRLISCLASMERPLCDPILESLPPLLRADLRKSPAARLMEDALGFSLSGTEAPRAGGVATLAKLAELVFIDILRRHVEST